MILSLLHGGPAMPKDPVCKNYVDVNTPFKEDMEGQTFYFCGEDCLEEFQENIDDYLTPAEEERIDLED